MKKIIMKKNIIKLIKKIYYNIFIYMIILINNILNLKMVK